MSRKIVRSARSKSIRKDGAWHQEAFFLLGKTAGKISNAMEMTANKDQIAYSRTAQALHNKE